MNYKLISNIFCWVFVPIFFFSPLISYSQNDLSNHKKYWYYKSRLNNDFVKVGTGRGESLPFNQRGLTLNNYNPINVEMAVGDATGTLGYYIALLATEYYLLKQNGQNTDKTKHELFCALNAINRLDAIAEFAKSPNSGIYTSLNGFFVRDDIPSNFISTNYSHFNYYDHGINNNTSSSGFMSKFTAGANKVSSDWKKNVDDNTNNNHLYESQDQAYNLLFGLAFVNKFVPDTETDGTNVFGFGSGETKLTIEARNITGRIIDFIRQSKSLGGVNCQNSAAIGWQIHNPVTCTPVATGDDAQLFGYPLAELECLIKTGKQSNNFTNFSLGSVPQLCPGFGYHNQWSQSLGYNAWNLFASSSVPNQDNKVFAENLSAVCNCVYGTVGDKVIQEVITILKQVPILSWLGVIIGWLWQFASIILTSFVPGAIVNTTSTAININAYPASPTPNGIGPVDHGPLARKVLHGGLYTQNPDYTIKYLLDVAPCDDIFYFTGGNYGHWEWSSTDRLDHAERRGGNPSFTGEYPAIDYMLYHNLWYIHQKQSGGTQNIVDLSDIKINQPLGLLCGNVNAFETISSENVNINCTNNIYWRAGKTIYFGNGTTITGNGSSSSGTNFHAYIQKFDCATDNGAFRLANTDTTNQENQSNSNNDSYEQGVKYHVVNYPNDSETSLQQAEYNDGNSKENLIIELPAEEDPIEKMMKATYSDYSKELFIKPTVTIDNVKAYFTMEDNEMAFINILDLNGKKVYENNNIKATDSGLTIDLSELANGTYLLKFTTTKGTNKTQKIIKQ